MRIASIDLGEKLRQRRELLGLLQSQLAALSGVSTRTIQLVEQGKGNPSLETLFQGRPHGPSPRLFIERAGKNR